MTSGSEAPVLVPGAAADVEVDTAQKPDLQRSRVACGVKESLLTLWRSNRSAALGLVAQLFTVSANLAPIAFSLEPALVYNLQVSAIVGIALSALTGCASITVPTTARREDAWRALSDGVSVMLCLSALTFAVGGVLVVGGHQGIGFVLMWIAVLGVTQGSYFCLCAAQTRRGGYAAIMRMRLVYGVVSLACTVAACVAHLGGGALVASFAIGYMAALFAGAGWTEAQSTLARWWHERSVSPRAACRCLNATKPLAVSSTLYALGGQAPAAFLPVLGPLSGAWAIVTVIASGLQTVALQVVAPRLEIGLAQGVRVRNRRQCLRAASFAVLAGIVLGACAVALSVAVVLTTSRSASFGGGGWLAFSCGLGGFTFVNVLLSPVSRVLNMLGGRAEMVLWTILRCGASVLALVAFRPPSTLVVLGVVTAATGIIYLWLVARRGRRMPLEPAGL